MEDGNNKNLIIILSIIGIVLVLACIIILIIVIVKFNKKETIEVSPSVPLPATVIQVPTIIEPKKEQLQESQPEILPESKQELKQELKQESGPESMSEIKSESMPEIQSESQQLNIEDGLKRTTITSALKGNYCLNIKNQSDGDNVEAIMHNCTGNTNELFSYIPTTKQIVVGNSKKCLSFDPSNMSGKNIVQKTCLDGNVSNISSQQFDLIGNAIKPSLNNDLCIDVKKSGKNDGTNVQLYKCNNTDAQKWFYNFGEPVGATTHPTTQLAETDNAKQIKNKLKENYCLSLSTNGYIMNDCMDDKTQKFYYNKNNQFVNSDNTCMSFDISKPAQLSKSPCVGTTSSNYVGQKFMMDNGAIKSSFNPKFCVDVKGSGKKNGTLVQMYKCNNSNAQKWIY
jgi:hypothetical protein